MTLQKKVTSLKLPAVLLLEGAPEGQEGVSRAALPSQSRGKKSGDGVHVAGRRQEGTRGKKKNQKPQPASRLDFSARLAFLPDHDLLFSLPFLPGFTDATARAYTTGPRRSQEKGWVRLGGSPGISFPGDFQE